MGCQYEYLEFSGRLKGNALNCEFVYFSVSSNYSQDQRLASILTVVLHDFHITLCDHRITSLILFYVSSDSFSESKALIGYRSAKMTAAVFSVSTGILL